jgi:hypothetical protein
MCYDWWAMNRHRIVRAVLLVTVALAARTAVAQVCSGVPGQNEVCMTPSSAAGDFAAALGTTPEQLTGEILNQVNTFFQNPNVNAFLHGFQNAQAFSAKGLGVDYASETTRVEVGGTLSLASNVDKAYKPSGSPTDPPISGGGANFSLMAGIGGRLVGLDPVMLFGNWFKWDGIKLGDLEGSYHNWGVHAQLRLFGPSTKSSATKLIVRWGGIAITSGADYSKMTLSARKHIAPSFNLPTYALGVPATVSAQGDLVFSLQQTTWTVPLEVTTSLRLLSLFTIYGGIGIDFQLGGGSDLVIGMENASVSGKAQGTTVDLGTASIRVGQHVSPSPARLREILGLQVGLFDVVRIFLQVNASGSSPMLASLAAGLRVGY